MIIAKDDIKNEYVYSGVDFLDTLEDIEKLYLEAGKNNKKLLEKEDLNKSTIANLTERNGKLLADIEEYKIQITELHEALKKTSFTPATDVKVTETDIPPMIILPLCGGALVPVVAVYEDGIRKF